MRRLPTADPAQDGALHAQQDKAGAWPRRMRILRLGMRFRQVFRKAAKLPTKGGKPRLPEPYWEPGLAAEGQAMWDDAFTATTDDITIRVRAFYLDEQSAPEDSRWVWAYKVRIENHGGDTVRLLGREWHITDAQGAGQYVVGDGVVGEQPVLAPGDSYEYTSGTPLSTSSGIMAGTYTMVSASGERFRVAVPTFSLDSPDAGGQIH